MGLGGLTLTRGVLGALLGFGCLAACPSGLLVGCSGLAVGRERLRPRLLAMCAGDLPPILAVALGEPCCGC